MNVSWALRLDAADAAALGPLRLEPGLEVGESGDDLWLRGSAADERLSLKLRSLPATARFEVVGNGRLRFQGSIIPGETFPQVPWTALARWLEADLPPAALPAVPPAKLALRLVRSHVEQPATLLRTTVGAWAGFALAAAQIRLERLEWAASDDGLVLVRGEPLPPLAGTRFVERDGVAVPAGFHWEPAVPSAVLRRLFNVADGAVVVWSEENSFVRLHPEQFAPASRSGVRASIADPEARP